LFDEGDRISLSLRLKHNHAFYFIEVNSENERIGIFWWNEGLILKRESKNWELKLGIKERKGKALKNKWNWKWK